MPLAQKDFAKLSLKLKKENAALNLSVADVPYLVECAKSEKYESYGCLF